MVRSGLLLVIAACGRIGFGTTDDAIAPSDVSTEVAPPLDAVDAPPDTSETEVMVSFGEGTTAMINGVTTDTYISSEAGEAGFNYGGDDEVRLEQDSGERALFRFDVSALPDGATVISASLTLHTVQIPPTPTQLELREVLEAWTEGTGAGSTGAANFMMRTAILPWSAIGAGSPASTTAPFATVMTPTTLVPVDVGITPALVQRWNDDPAQNFGFAIFSNGGESTRFATSENVASQRPILIVRYVP